MYVASNFGFGSLAAPIEAGDLTITLQPLPSGSSFPDLGPNDWTWGVLFASNGTGNPEIIRIDGITRDGAIGHVLTCTRGLSNTAARAWAAGDRLELRMVAAVLDDIRSPGGPIALSQAQYDALDPPTPGRLHVVPETEQRAEQRRAAVTGPQVRDLLQGLPEGTRLEAGFIDGLAAAARTAAAASLGTRGPLIGTCTIPSQAAVWAAGVDIAGARWEVGPASREDWRTGASHYLTQDRFDAMGRPIGRPGPADDGWWVETVVAGMVQDAGHVPEGLFDAHDYITLFALGRGETIRVAFSRARATTGRDAEPNRVNVWPVGDGTTLPPGLSLRVTRCRYSLTRARAA